MSLEDAKARVNAIPIDVPKADVPDSFKIQDYNEDGTRKEDLPEADEEEGQFADGLGLEAMASQSVPKAEEETNEVVLQATGTTGAPTSVLPSPVRPLSSHSMGSGSLGVALGEAGVGVSKPVEKSPVDEKNETLPEFMRRTGAEVEGDDDVADLDVDGIHSKPAAEIQGNKEPAQAEAVVEKEESHHSVEKEPSLVEGIDYRNLKDAEVNLYFDIVKREQQIQELSEKAEDSRYFTEEQRSFIKNTIQEYQKDKEELFQTFTIFLKKRQAPELQEVALEQKVAVKKEAPSILQEQQEPDLSYKAQELSREEPAQPATQTTEEEPLEEVEEEAEEEFSSTLEKPALFEQFAPQREEFEKVFGALHEKGKRQVDGAVKKMGVIATLFKGLFGTTKKAFYESQQHVANAYEETKSKIEEVKDGVNQKALLTAAEIFNFGVDIPSRFFQNLSQMSLNTAKSVEEFRFRNLENVVAKGGRLSTEETGKMYKRYQDLAKQREEFQKIASVS